MYVLNLTLNYECISTYIVTHVCVLATLPWPERVKRSIENFENEREETRREQQVIGEIVHFNSSFIVLNCMQAKYWTKPSLKTESISRQDWSDFPGKEESKLVRIDV